MPLIKSDFLPARIKSGENQGYSLLTYIGSEVKAYPVTDKETGEVIMNDNGTPKEFEKLYLHFDVLGFAKDTKVIKLSEYNGLSKILPILEKLGYCRDSEVDELGLETIKSESDPALDELGLGLSFGSNDELEKIDQFLESLKGTKFLGKIEKNSKGFWVIVADTIKPVPAVTK